MNDRLIGMGDVASVLSFFLPLRWLSAAVQLQGRQQYRRHIHRRNIVRENLTTAFSDRCSATEIDTFTRQFFEYQQVRNLLMTLAPRMPLAHMERLFPLEGVAHLDAALAQGRGVLLLGCHLNSLCMFLGIKMLRERGYPIQVALPEEEDAWAPTRFGRLLGRVSPAPSTKEMIGGFYCQFNIRPLVRILAKNEIIAQTGDGWHSAKFVDVPFLGRTLPFTTGALGVAQVSGAVVVPMFELGAPPDRLRFVIEEPFTVEKGSPADLQAKVAAYVQRLEQHLLDNIPCWQHWSVERVFDAMAAWRERSLEERYVIADRHPETHHHAGTRTAAACPADGPV